MITLNRSHSGRAVCGHVPRGTAHRRAALRQRFRPAVPRSLPGIRVMFVRAQAMPYTFAAKQSKFTTIRRDNVIVTTVFVHPVLSKHNTSVYRFPFTTPRTPYTPNIRAQAFAACFHAGGKLALPSGVAAHIDILHMPTVPTAADPLRVHSLALEAARLSLGSFFSKI